MGTFQQTIKKLADSSELKLFRKVKDVLTVSDNSDIVLKNSRIVVPTVLHEKAISLAYEGHQGLVKTKRLLRETVWFPGIDHPAKTIETCLTCQANSPDNPLQTSPLPPAPWHTRVCNHEIPGIRVALQPTSTIVMPVIKKSPANMHKPRTHCICLRTSCN